MATRGFASMDKNRQREIARQGGKIAHLTGKAHQWTPEQAREAGRKGGITQARMRVLARMKDATQLAQETT